MPDHLTRADLEAIQKLHAESTPGEWPHNVDGIEDELRCQAYAIGPVRLSRAEAIRDAAFIAAAHQDVPRLIADLLYWRRRWATTVRTWAGPIVPGHDAICSDPNCKEARAILAEEKNP